MGTSVEIILVLSSTLVLTWFPVKPQTPETLRDRGKHFLTLCTSKYEKVETFTNNTSYCTFSFTESLFIKFPMLRHDTSADFVAFDCLIVLILRLVRRRNAVINTSALICYEALCWAKLDTRRLMHLTANATPSTDCLLPPADPGRRTDQYMVRVR